MKLELDFTNKVIVVVGKGSVKEFMDIINTPNFKDWDIDVMQYAQYIPSYPYYPPYPTYSTSEGLGQCDCTENKCNAE